jgi:CTP synthase (UTP-ammonia lyase)
VDTVRIAVVGDYQPSNETHLATDAAVAHAAGERGLAAETTWIATTALAAEGGGGGGAGAVLAPYDAVWIAPGSPYRSMRGALDAIAHARANDVPLLGTCGGFQHVVIEFARNVAGIPDAAHAEYDPDASRLLVDALACSLVGQTMDVTLVEGSVAAAAYAAGGAAGGTAGGTAGRVRERYYCRFGLDPEHVPALTRAGLAISGVDQDGEVRVVELPGLRFFVATLFVPQASSAPGAPHPLVAAYLAAAGRRAVGATAP